MSNFSPALYLPEYEAPDHRDAVLAAEHDLLATGHRRMVSDTMDGVYQWTCQCGRADTGYGFRAYAEDAWREAHGLDPIVTLMG